MKIRSIFAFIFVFISNSAWASDFAIGGAGSNATVVEILTRHFEKKTNHSPIKVITTLGSKGGVAALNDGKIQIAMTARALTPAEVSLDLVSVPYSKSCLAFVVNPTVAAEENDISIENVIQIYDGSKTKWLDKKTINVIFRARGDSGADLLMTVFPEIQKTFEKAWASGIWRTEFNHRKGLKMIEKINYAIGWANQSELLATHSTARIIKFSGVAPSAAAAAAGTYPLVETHSFVYKEPATKDVKDFIAFVKSDAGARILRKNESFPVR